MVGIQIPTDMIPASFRDLFFSGEGTMMIIQYEKAGASEKTMNAISEIRSICNEKYFLAGFSVVIKDTRDLVDKELPIFVGLAVVLALPAYYAQKHASVYPGYHRLPEHIRVVGCWAHLRRKFDEAVKSLPQKDQANSAALQGQAYCSRLFSIEQELAELPPEERYTQRLERSKPVMDALLAWAETTNAAPKSALGKAVYYLKEQWPYLIRVLEDGRLELSNNLAERSIKPFVIGRKNFLFANTPWGAQGSAVIYSMIETAKESGLDPYRYLTWLLTNAPILAARDDSWADKFLPANAPADCHSLQQNS